MTRVDSIRTVGVVGAGTMGAGIAQVAATAGYEVTMVDVESDLVDAGFDRIDDSLDRLVGKDELTREEADAARDRIDGSTETEDLADADLAIEAVVESMNVKRDVFCRPRRRLCLRGHPGDKHQHALDYEHRELDGPAGTGRRPPLHEPRPRDARRRSRGWREDQRGCAPNGTRVRRSLDKETWESDDKPGFVVNRVLMPWINEGSGRTMKASRRRTTSTAG